jgi:CTD small phosphatase-like protein 2
MEDLVIVDNSIISFAFQLDNGIPICAFYGENKYQDQELLYLITYLDGLFINYPDDSRRSNSKTFKLKELFDKVG